MEGDRLLLILPVRLPTQACCVARAIDGPHAWAMSAVGTSGWTYEAMPWVKSPTSPGIDAPHATRRRRHGVALSRREGLVAMLDPQHPVAAEQRSAGQPAF